MVTSAQCRDYAHTTSEPELCSRALNWGAPAPLRAPRRASLSFDYGQLARQALLTHRDAAAESRWECKRRRGDKQR